MVVPELADEIPGAPVDATALIELADRYGLDSSVNRVLNAIARTRR